MDFGMGDKGFIWESDPAKRREVAKKLLPAFSTKAIKAKEPTVHKYIDLFVNKMKELGCKGDGVEINEGNHPPHFYLLKLTLANICTILPVVAEMVRYGSINRSRIQP